MKKIVRLMGSLTGILLMLLAGGLLMARRGDPSPIMLVTSTSLHTKSVVTATYLIVPGTNLRQRVLPDAYEIETRGWSPDGKWFYGMLNRHFGESESRTGTMWRMAATSGQVEMLPALKWLHHGGLWTPDGQWLLNNVLTEANSRRNGIQRVRLDGTTQLLTAEFEMSAGLIQISPDGQWIIFNSLDGENRPVDMYRMPIEGGVPQNLTSTIEGLPLQTVWPAESEWALVSATTGLYRVRQDGSAADFLLPDREPDDRESLMTYLPNAGVVLVKVTRNEQFVLMAIQVATGERLWERPAMNFFAYTPDEKWILLKTSSAALYRIRPDGSEWGQVVESQTSHTQYWVVTPDSQSVIYSEPRLSQAALYRATIETGQVEMIYPFVDGLSITTISPDSGWLMVIILQNQVWRTLWLKADGSQSRPLTDLERARFLTWLPPLDRAWTPAALIITGIILASMALIPRPFFKRKRPAP